MQILTFQHTQLQPNLSNNTNQIPIPNRTQHKCMEREQNKISIEQNLNKRLTTRRDSKSPRIISIVCVMKIVFCSKINALRLALRYYGYSSGTTTFSSNSFDNGENNAQAASSSLLLMNKRCSPSIVSRSSLSYAFGISLGYLEKDPKVQMITNIVAKDL